MHVLRQAETQEASIAYGEPEAQEVDPGLLDVVPWDYGFAHNWALQALLSNQATAGSALGAVRGLPGRAPHTVEGPVRSKERLRPSRADLALRARDRAGAIYEIAIQTKVGDLPVEEQIEAHRRGGRVPVAYLPGLTGLLLEPVDPPPGEGRLYGGDLAEALRGKRLGFLLSDYASELRREAERMAAARKAAHRGVEIDIAPGQAPVDDVRDHAWLAEVYRCLTAACRDAEGVQPGAQIRQKAHNRGIFLEGSCVDLGADALLYVEVIATLRGHERFSLIRAGGAGMLEAWDRAAAARHLLGDRWEKGRRSTRGDSATVLRRSLTGVSAADAAEEAVIAAEFIRQVARR